MRTEIEHCRHFSVENMMCNLSCPKSKKWSYTYLDMYCIKTKYTMDCRYYED